MSTFPARCRWWASATGRGRSGGARADHCAPSRGGTRYWVRALVPQSPEDRTVTIAKRAARSSQPDDAHRSRQHRPAELGPSPNFRAVSKNLRSEIVGKRVSAHPSPYDKQEKARPEVGYPTTAPWVMVWMAPTPGIDVPKCERCQNHLRGAIQHPSYHDRP